MKKALEQAVAASNTDGVFEQIRRGALLDSPNRHGQTALMLAAMRGNVNLTQLLIDHGADLDIIAKYGLSALMLAVLNNHEEVVRLLCAAGADSSITGTGAPRFSGLTAMDLAERMGQSNIIAAARASDKRIS